MISKQICQQVLLLGTVLLGATLVWAQQAEEETTLLTITGNLIDRLDSVDENDTADSVLASYYALLPETTRAQLAELRQNMDSRSEDYQVAFRSGDTAEMNETLDDLSFYWASMRTVHAQEFTEAAIADITAAYYKLYRFLRSN
ncbi:MAG: hypothetical protein RL839_09805 [Gammaproteobacteria bacterium]